MDFRDLLQNNKWKLLEAVSKGFNTPSDISKNTGMSLPHITQNLAILEASGFIKKTKNKKETEKEKEKNEEKKVGKPKTMLSINKEQAFFSIISGELTVKKSFSPKRFHKELIKILINTKEEDHYFLLRFLCKEEISDKIQAVAFIDSNEHEIHLLVITEYLDFIRSNFSNLFIKNPFDNSEKKIVCWSHSIKELNEGLSRKEAYFENLMKKPVPLIDKIDYFK